MTKPDSEHNARPGLEGRVVIVTGSGRGIGRGIALSLAARGCRLIVTSRTPEDLDPLVSEIENSGSSATAVVAELRDPATPKRLVEASLDQYGRIDGLVNNAGVNRLAPFWLQPDQYLDEIIDTNLTVPFFLSLAVARHWIDAGVKGSIVNISSTEDRIAYPEQAPYAASKGGLRTLTRLLALEFAEHDIRVNAVSPGSIDTEMTVGDIRDKAAELIPAGRLGAPSEVGACVAFLLSDDSSYVVGASLLADGGYVLQ
jgi:NAD(P)-dependent dehydrogenase (short-subunit alcohol dehydrogenase family)